MGRLRLATLRDRRRGGLAVFSPFGCGELGLGSLIPFSDKIGLVLSDFEEVGCRGSGVPWVPGVASLESDRNGLVLSDFEEERG